MYIAYFAKDVLSSPIKASAAPLTAVFLQPKWSVNMLTTGEQKKIMPMARAPTQAGEEEDRRGTIHHQTHVETLLVEATTETK